jgi:hypothetical protein
LDFYDVVKQGAVEPLFDLMGCGMQSTALSGTGSTGCIPREELEFVRSSGEAEEFDGKMLDSAGRRVLFEANIEWCSDVGAVGRWVFERDFRQPRGTMLELGTDAYGVDTPANAPGVIQRSLDQFAEGVSEHGSVSNGVGEVEAHDDWRWALPSDDWIECGANCELPCMLALGTEL